MRRSVENAETVGMRQPRSRRGRGRGRRGRGRGRRASDTYDPPARRACTAQTLTPDTSPPSDTHGNVKSVPENRCYCPITPSYLYGINLCDDCGGHRSTYRLSNNGGASRSLHAYSSSAPTSPASVEEPTHEAVTPFGPVEFQDTLLGNCCHCATSPSYLYGVNPCPDCGGRRSSHRLNYNRDAAQHLHCYCLASPTYLQL
jgi:hypothetical protein